MSCPINKSNSNGYNHYGCRCEECSSAASQYNARYRARPESLEKRRIRDARPERIEKRRICDALPENKEKKKLYNAYRETKRYSVLASIKLERGCYDCGFNSDPDALHFDHVRGKKEFDLSRASGSSWDRIANEIAKCEVRCANCHALQTAKRRQ
jgi:hypothetical protein